MAEEKDKKNTSTLTVHPEFHFPSGKVVWSTPAIERHAQILIKYVVVCESETPSQVTFFCDKAICPEKDWPIIRAWPNEQETEKLQLTHGGTIRDDLPRLLDKFPILQLFNAADSWSILRKAWPESEQRMFSWRRKTKDLFDAIKKTKACWFPTLSGAVGNTPDLYTASSLTEEQWAIVENAPRLADAARSQAATGGGRLGRQQLSMPDDDDKEEQKQEVDEERSPFDYISHAVLQLHQTSALFSRVEKQRLPLFVRKGGRGRAADDIVPVKIDKFLLPAARSAQFDSLFHELI